jgi:hypothetical protein
MLRRAHGGGLPERRSNASQKQGRRALEIAVSPRLLSFQHKLGRMS